MATTERERIARNLRLLQYILEKRGAETHLLSFTMEAAAFLEAEQIAIDRFFDTGIRDHVEVNA